MLSNSDGILRPREFRRRDHLNRKRVICRVFVTALNAFPYVL